MVINVHALALFFQFCRRNFSLSTHCMCSHLFLFQSVALQDLFSSVCTKSYLSLSLLLSSLFSFLLFRLFLSCCQYALRRVSLFLVSVCIQTRKQEHDQSSLQEEYTKARSKDSLLTTNLRRQLGQRHTTHMHHTTYSQTNWNTHTAEDNQNLNLLHLKSIRHYSSAQYCFNLLFHQRSHLLFFTSLICVIII